MLATSLQVKKFEFQRNVLRWAKSNIRGYSWRDERRNPYEILVAELLLKRTTAAAANHLYQGFLEKYPTVDDLAQSTEAELAHDLISVGLHIQRAKAVSKLAHYLIEHEAGSTPDTLDRLLKVPGIGSYSARAVLSFGYGKPAAVLDVNVVRVLTRVFRQGLPKRPTTKLLQELADNLLPEEAHRDFNFALLDLGALVCRYDKPKCNLCPLVDVCDYTDSNKKPAEAKVIVLSRVRQLRIQKGLSLVKLAKKSQVSKLTIINIEAGRTNARRETLEKLAKGLDVPLTALSVPKGGR